MQLMALGCLALSLATAILALAREIRLRRAWQRLWFQFVDKENQDAEHNGGLDLPSLVRVPDDTVPHGRVRL